MAFTHLGRVVLHPLVVHTMPPILARSRVGAMLLTTIVAREGVLDVRAGSTTRRRGDGGGSLGVTLAETAHVPVRRFVVRSIADGAGPSGPAVVGGVSPAPALVA